MPYARFVFQSPIDCNKAKRAAAPLMLLGVLLSSTGCREKARVGSGGSPEQRELMHALLEAHDKGDVQGEQALVNWDGVTDAYKAHFTEHQLRGGLRHRILSINIVNLPDVGPERFEGYSSTPEKFLEVQYGGSRSDKANLYPIGKKDGRYYIVLETGI